MGVATVRIKNYLVAIKKKKKKHGKIVLLEKDKLGTMEVLIYKVLINSYIIHDAFVSINHALRGYNAIKKK